MRCDFIVKVNHEGVVKDGASTTFRLGKKRMKQP